MGGVGAGAGAAPTPAPSPNVGADTFVMFSTNADGTAQPTGAAQLQSMLESLVSTLFATGSDDDDAPLGPAGSVVGFLLDASSGNPVQGVVDELGAEGLNAVETDAAGYFVLLPEVFAA